MKDVKLELTRGKVTPHKIRFEMDTNNPISASCYIMKEVDSKMGSPKKLIVTITIKED
jgi:hypothetical protein